MQSLLVLVSLSLASFFFPLPLPPDHFGGSLMGVKNWGVARIMETETDGALLVDHHVFSVT